MMNMPDDVRIRFFRNQLMDTVNKEPLPLEVKRLVIAEVLAEVSKAADENVKNFLKDATAKKEENPNPEKSPE